VALPWIDEHHLARSDLARLRPVVEMQASHGDDERQRDSVTVLGHLLPGLKAKADDPHRPAIGDLLEPEGARLPALPTMTRR